MIDNNEGLREHLVLRVVAKLLIPVILIFALYVQFHGDFGPGGGFQAGVIVGAAFILYTLVFGVDAAFLLLSPALLRIFVASGVLIYAMTGVVTMLKGGEFLNYNVLSQDPLHGQHYGILIIELGVGITVFSVLVTIFYAFVSQTEN